MADNLIIHGKIGETGKVITVTLKAAGEPQSLTGYTQLKMQVETSGGAVIMNEVACELADQSTNPGVITCTTDMTTDTHANLRPGKYRVEFSGLNGDGKKRYWPMNAKQERTYGTFIVQAALS